jgi:hypothetical protein
LRSHRPLTHLLPSPCCPGQHCPEAPGPVLEQPGPGRGGGAGRRTEAQQQPAVAGPPEQPAGRRGAGPAGPGPGRQHQPAGAPGERVHEAPPEPGENGCGGDVGEGGGGGEGGGRGGGCGEEVVGRLLVAEEVVGLKSQKVVGSNPYVCGLPVGILAPSCSLKEKSGVKWIWDMFSMITSWNVRLGAKKRIYTHS